MRNSSMSCAGICAFPATSRSETTMFNLKEYRSSNTRLADFLPWAALVGDGVVLNKDGSLQRSEEHTSELQSLMRNSYTVFCMKHKQAYAAHDSTSPAVTRAYQAGHPHNTVHRCHH